MGGEEFSVATPTDPASRYRPDGAEDTGVDFTLTVTARSCKYWVGVLVSQLPT